MGTLAVGHCRAGNPRETIAILTQLLPTFRAVPFVPAEIFTPYLAEAYWRERDVPMTLKTLEEMVRIMEPRSMRLQLGIGHRLLGEIRSIEDPDEAIAHFGRSIWLLNQSKALPELALTHVAHARLQMRLAQVGGAHESVVRALDIFERIGTNPERVRAELAGLPLNTVMP